MKTFKHISIKVVLMTAVCLFAYNQSKAQVSKNGYLHIDWQYNVPLGSDNYADKSSGWGMNFDGGYYVTPRIAVGAFINYHTNNQHIPRETFMLNDHSAVTTDQIHSVFQLPYGLSGLYRFNEDATLEPYVALKLGVNYAKFTSYFGASNLYDKTWGFYLSPEVGMNIFPSYKARYGFHVAAYYSFATNKANLIRYSINNLNNFGIRVGVTF